MDRAKKLVAQKDDMDCNEQDSGGQTPVMAALYSGDEHVIQRLVRVCASRIDVTLVDEDEIDLVSAVGQGVNDQMYSSIPKVRKVLRFLHEVPRIGSLILGSVLYPCLFDFERDIPHMTKEEAEKGLLEIVSDTLRDCPGVDVNTIDAGGQTPLIYAAYRAAPALVQRLLNTVHINVNFVSQQPSALIRDGVGGKDALMTLLADRRSALTTTGSWVTLDDLEPILTDVLAV